MTSAFVSPKDIVVKTALLPFTVLISFFELICPPKLPLIFSAALSDKDFAVPFCELESYLFAVDSESLDFELPELPPLDEDELLEDDFLVH